eukprot:354411-Chlamydomonas_euryale.AAC.3
MDAQPYPAGTFSVPDGVAAALQRVAQARSEEAGGEVHTGVPPCALQPHALLALCPPPSTLGAATFQPAQPTGPLTDPVPLPSVAR